MKLWYQLRLAMYDNSRRAVAGRQAREEDFFFRRGLLSLMEGDIANAKMRFEQTTIPAIKDWDLPERRNAQAELYLRLIRQAEKSGK
jgi:hypothetical protein